jgi:hypothetical protein
MTLLAVVSEGMNNMASVVGRQRTYNTSNHLISEELTVRYISSTLFLFAPERWPPLLRGSVGRPSTAPT